MTLRSTLRTRPSWKPRLRSKHFALKAKPRSRGILRKETSGTKHSLLGTAAGRKAGRRVNRLPEWTDSRSYITKGGRHRLFGKDYTNLSALACLRTIQRYGVPTCECGCRRIALWDDLGLIAERGELAHNEHGARKSDELHRVKWMRHECHMKSHNCGGKPITVTKKSLKEKVA